MPFIEDIADEYNLDSTPSSDSLTGLHWESDTTCFHHVSQGPTKRVL